MLDSLTAETERFAQLSPVREYNSFQMIRGCAIRIILQRSL